MKALKQKLLILIIILGFTVPAFCTWQAGSELNKPETEFAADTLLNDTIMVYTCPMHPEILSGKPGNCPKCGMQLVVKSSSISSNRGGHHKMGMMPMPMNDMNHSKEKTHPNKMIIVMGTMMGVMMLVMIVLVTGL